MESLGELKIFLSRWRVIGDWDAWTLIPVVLSLLAILAALAFYAWSLSRRLKSRDGVDWDDELGVDPTPLTPRERFTRRLWLAALCFLSIFTGAGAMFTGRLTTRDRRHHYSTEGTPARVAGGILCAAGLMLGLAALFQDSRVLNRRLGGRELER